MPLDRKRDRGGSHHTEVVGAVRVLPYVLAVHDQIFPESLLNPRMEFVAPPRTNCPTHTGNIRRRYQKGDDWITASGAGNDQIFVERRFHGACIRNAEHRITRLDVVRDASPRLGLGVFAESTVDISPNPNVECPIPL